MPCNNTYVQYKKVCINYVLLQTLSPYNLVLYKGIPLKLSLHKAFTRINFVMYEKNACKKIGHLNFVQRL